jgi:predicted enzyme related to lactoylglutathione lyase
MNVLGVDFISLEVSDLDKAVAFYRDVLGLELAGHWPDVPWAEFNVAPTTLALTEAPKDRELITGGSVALAVEDVGAAIAELQEAGVKVLLGPAESPVCNYALIADPDGNVLGIHRRHDGTVG